jgi:hypothetical protein
MRLSMDKPPLQSRQSVVILAPLKEVWEFNQDLSKIASFHPRVGKVDFISGTSRRKEGAAYRCHLKDGKNTCVEKDIEIIPMKKIVTKLPEDTMGLSKIFPDYLVETSFNSLGEKATKMEFRHYYSTMTLQAKLINLIAKRRIARESEETLNAIKNSIEYGAR